MLKHCNEEEVKTMPKTPEEAEEMSKKNTKNETNKQKTNINEEPMTRAKTKVIAKQKELKELYSDDAENTNKNLSIKNTQCTYGALKTCAQKSAVHNHKTGAPNFCAQKSSVQNHQNWGAGKKTGISEIRYIDMDILKIDINRYI